MMTSLSNTTASSLIESGTPGHLSPSLDLTDGPRRRALLTWSAQVAEAVQATSPETAAQIRQAADAFRKNRFVLTILGKAKRGKSTLINALLGRRDDALAPIDKLPASNVLSRFSFGDSLQAKVYFRSADPAALIRSIPPAQIREYVTEEENPENRKQVECLEVSGPFADFDPDLVLVDTPGAGSIHRYHDDIVRAVIPQSDAILFLVTAMMPLDRDELELLKQIQAADVRKVFFAINRIDQATDEELQQAEAHNRALLQQVSLNPDMLHRISARRAFEGDWEGGGLPALAAELRTFLATGKSQVLAARFISRVTASVEPILRGLEAEMAFRDQSAEERAAIRMQLAHRRNSSIATNEQREAAFRRAWAAAIDGFAAELKFSRGVVEASLQRHIHETSLSRLSQLTEALPSRIVSEIEAAARSHAWKMESALQKACVDLGSTAPDLSLSSLNVAGAITESSGGGLRTALASSAVIGAGGAAVAASQIAAASAFQAVTSQSLIGAALTAYVGVPIPVLTTTMVPTALPAWAIIAGPVGWTLLGLGALAVPLSWTLRKVKLKDQLAAQTLQHVERIYTLILKEQLPLLQRSGEAILDEQRQREERDRSELEAALERAEAQSSGNANSERQLEGLKSLLASAEAAPA